MITLEALALYSLKYSTKTQHSQYLIAGMILYAGVGYCIYRIVNSGNGVGITNTIWNIASTIYGLLIGIIIFGERITNRQAFGIMLGGLGLIFMGYGLNDKA